MLVASIPLARSSGFLGPKNKLMRKKLQETLEIRCSLLVVFLLFWGIIYKCMYIYIFIFIYTHIHIYIYISVNIYSIYRIV